MRSRALRIITILMVVGIVCAADDGFDRSTDLAVGLFGISGITPDPSYFDELAVDVATSGFWVGASADFFGGSKEALHTRQFRLFVEKGIAPIGTFYLGAIDDGAVPWAEAIVEFYHSGTGAADVGAPVLYWELGDEENGSWGTGCSPEEYARRVSVLGSAVRSGCPDCEIVMGGLLDGPEMGDWALAPYLEAFLAAGGGEWIDVYAFHYYGLARPNTATPDAQLYDSAEEIVADMKSLLGEYGEEGSPIWVTETCTFSGRMGMIAQSESEQAADLVKRYVLLWSLGVEVVQWCYLTEPQYEGTGVGFFDQSGLIYDGLGPCDQGAGTKKKAYFAYVEMIEQLRGAAFLERVQASGVTLVSFETDTGPIAVLWQDPWRREGPVWIESAGTVGVVDLYGDPVLSGSGFTRIDLSIEPVYVLGDIADVRLSAPPLQAP